MDTISLYQAGFDCAVASLGTSLTADHAKLLSRFTKEVVICYDADSAGVQAANRAIPMLEKTGLKVKVLRVTGAKDPDEFLRSFGRDAFARLLDRSKKPQTPWCAGAFPGVRCLRGLPACAGGIDGPWSGTGPNATERRRP